MTGTVRDVVGLMAGTSLDGIDAARVRTDGRTLEREGRGATFPYRDETAAAIRRAIELGSAVVEHAGLCREIDRLVADDHAAAVRALLGDAVPDLIGFHGQTVHHAPAIGLSVQLGDPARLAHGLGVDVVARFRDADVAAGGQGAPLAPVYQGALLDALDIAGPAALLNIGGVANLGYRDADGLVGFDCGPGNALLDRCVRERTGATFDAGGRLALAGRSDAAIVRAVTSEPFFAAPWPKSLDRDAFVAHPALATLRERPVEDALATLAAITVEGARLGVASLPAVPERLVVTGGGQHNAALLEGLRRALRVRVDAADALGVPGDLVEAELMAFLAVRHLEGLPITFPGTTGVAGPLCGGRLYRAGTA